MSHGSDVIFVYDGSFEGLMCCIFRCYNEKTMPSDILPDNAEQLVFGNYIEIITEPEKAARVENGIREKIGKDIFTFLRKSFLSCEPDKDMLILRFVILGFRYGRNVKNMLTDDTVNRLMKAERFAAEEAHLFMGFVRFSQHSGVLVSVIEPKNSVIPLIAEHFCDRFRSERFIIFDRNHHLALFHEPGRAEIIEIDNIELDSPDDSEILYSGLWKTFFETIGIKERYNPTCQRNLLPLRYRGVMTEFSDDENKLSERNDLLEKL